MVGEATIRPPPRYYSRFVEGIDKYFLAVPAQNQMQIHFRSHSSSQPKQTSDSELLSGQEAHGESKRAR